jgi:hypothetical protein
LWAALDPGHATDLDVLAELGDGGGARFLGGFAGRQLGRLERFRVACTRGQRGSRDGVGEADEIDVLGDEVGFGVDFDQHRLAARLGDGDAAFRGNAAGFLVGLGQARLAQEFHRGVDVAAVLAQRLLAFHHAGAGPLAQFLDQGCGDFSHCLPRSIGSDVQACRLLIDRSIQNAQRSAFGRRGAWQAAFAKEGKIRNAAAQSRAAA